jgi:hypothetical protein
MPLVGTPISDVAREVFPQLGVIIELSGKPEVDSFFSLFK